MNNETLKYLKSHDSTVYIEAPPDGDWESSMVAVRTVKPQAEEILGMSLWLDENVQDASFFTELGAFEEGAVGSDGSRVLMYKIAIRFSNFGRMATIHTNSTRSNLQDYPVDRLIRLLEENGFHYIDQRDLDEPYTGSTEILKPGTPWWFRYFDYM